jgi:hypothetical protein
MAGKDDSTLMLEICTSKIKYIYMLYLLELGHDENGYIDEKDKARLKKLKSVDRETTILERIEKFAKELEKA